MEDGKKGQAASPAVVCTLAAYVLGVASGACVTLIAIFPSSPDDWGSLSVGQHVILAVRGQDQGLVMLALLSGLLGSFMHASQSLGAYVGNRQLQTSWTLWYVLRLPVGGVLGMLFYFILRAGLIPSAGSQASDAVSPYGVVAFGGLAGWFSKRATDKLAEIFETLFRTAKDLEYKDKLAGNGKPRIVKVEPQKIQLVPGTAPAAVTLLLTCEGLVQGAWASIDGSAIPTRFIDDKHLECTIPASFGLKPKTTVELVVMNPLPPNPPADATRSGSDAFLIPVE